MRRNEQGFTLVEILVVMVIIGILASLIAGNFVGTRLKARDSRRKNDLTQVQRSLEAYMNDHGRYPNDDGAGSIVVDSVSLRWGVDSFQDSKNTVYMATLPDDPNSAAFRYVYVAQNDGTKYQIFAMLENVNDVGVTSGANFPNCDDAGTSTACNFGVSSSNTTIDTALD